MLLQASLAAARCAALLPLPCARAEERDEGMREKKKAKTPFKSRTENSSSSSSSGRQQQQQQQQL